MVDHQGCQLLASNEDDLRGDDSRILVRVSREPRRGDEDPLVRALPLKGAGELLDLRTPNRPLPSFGLHVDHVETELVLLDDPVDAAIAASAYRLARILARATVAHGDQQIDYQTFEEGWCGGFHLLQDLGFQVAAEPLIGLREKLFWCGFQRCR